MVVEEVEAPDPAEGEALVRLDAIGVNFIDVNQRSGAYPISLPFTPGTEGAGVVEAVGPGVSEVSPGDRVAYAGVPAAYSQYATAEASRLVPLPDAVGADLAAAVMLQGMTAHYLVNSICTFDEGDWCLIHAAAGGVGLLLTQLAKRRGLQVIGTVSTSTKADELEEQESIMRSITPRRISPPRCMSSHTAQAFELCSSRSASRPSTRASNVYPSAATWCCSVKPAVRSTQSTSAGSNGEDLCS